jgi:hypothetical protein
MIGDPVNSFSNLLNLVIGNNTITHGLNVTPAQAIIVQVMDTATGEQVDFRLLTYTNNSVVVNVGMAITNCRVNVIRI